MYLFCLCVTSMTCTFLPDGYFSVRLLFVDVVGHDVSGEAEVADLADATVLVHRIVERHQDVPGSQVAVDHLFARQVSHALCDLK
jgi:hypothetical protein